MFVFCGLDSLEIPRLGGAGNFSHVWGVVSSGCSGSLVIFPTEDRQVRGPPRFGVVGGPGYRRVRFQESYQAVKRFRHPFIQLRGCGAWGRSWDLESLNDRVEGFPVRVRPARSQGFLIRGWRSQGDRYWYVIGTPRGEGRFPALNYGKEGGVCKGEVYDRRASVPYQGEPCVLAWGIKEGESGFCRFLKVGSRVTDFPVREVS